MTQHDGLTRERWSAFSVDQQVLMIANEMNRVRKLVLRGDAERRRNAWERVLRLTDLTVSVQSRRGFRRELLRFRDEAARLYLRAEPDPDASTTLLRHLLLLTPGSAHQRAPLGLS